MKKPVALLFLLPLVTSCWGFRPTGSSERLSETSDRDQAKQRLASIEAYQASEEFIPPLDEYVGTTSTTMSLFNQNVSASFEFSFDDEGHYFRSYYEASLENIGKIHGETWVYLYQGEHGHTFVIEATESLDLIVSLLSGQIFYTKKYNRYEFVEGKFHSVLAGNSSYATVEGFASNTYSYEFGKQALEDIESTFTQEQITKELYQIGPTTIHAEFTINDGGNNAYDMSFFYEGNLGLGYTKVGKVGGTQQDEKRQVSWQKEKEHEYPDLAEFTLDKVEDAPEED